MFPRPSTLQSKIGQAEVKTRKHGFVGQPHQIRLCAECRSHYEKLLNKKVVCHGAMPFNNILPYLTLTEDHKKRVETHIPPKHDVSIEQPHMRDMTLKSGKRYEKSKNHDGLSFIKNT